MAIDPPYRFDPWQNLVNVHWESPTGGTWGGSRPYKYAVLGAEIEWMGCLQCYGTFVAYGTANGIEHFSGGTWSGMPEGKQWVGHMTDHGWPTLNASPGGLVMTSSVTGNNGYEYVSPHIMDFSNARFELAGIGTYLPTVAGIQGWHGGVGDQVEPYYAAFSGWIKFEAEDIG